MALQRKIISTEKAPAAVGPYSQAVQLGDLIYTAGQIPLVPETGQLISDDIEEQTRQVMQNLTQVLAAAGSSRGNMI
jgi:2-iminobutanoate/2-iminopropanoate deaminase